MVDIYEKLALDTIISEKSLNARKRTIEVLHSHNKVGEDDEAYGVRLAFDDVRNSPIPLENILLTKDNAEAKQIISNMLAMDADTYQFNIASQGVPEWFSTVWVNEQIEQVIQITQFENLTHPFQQGVWGITNIKIPTISGSFNSQPYDDFAGTGDVDVNINWVDRQTVMLQTTMKYGDLSQELMGMAKINYVGQLRSWMLKQIKLDFNRIGFFGYQAGGNTVDATNMAARVFGLLNDPGLNSFIQAAASIADPSSTQWYNKSYLEIYQDILTLYESAISNNEGQVSMTDKAKLGVSNSAYIWLATQNSLGTNTVLSFLKESFPNLTILPVPDYDGTGTPIGSENPNYCQLIFDTIGGTKVARNAFVTPYHSHGVVRLNGYSTEKISYQTAGSIVTYPSGIVTMYGI